jgi:tetratricopeptide (TPR) repeat protein
MGFNQGVVRANPVLILQSSSTDNCKESAKAALLKTLDGLPLAISQAGRFVNSLNISLDTYLDMYTSSRSEVMDALPAEGRAPESSEDLANAKGSIRTTWTISINQLKERMERQGCKGDYYRAYKLLTLFAYFEPSDLHFDIIQRGLISNKVPDWFRETFSSKIRFFATVKILLDFSLVDRNAEEGSFSMHRVVHDWLCIYVGNETEPELLQIAVSSLALSAPPVFTDAWAEEQQRLVLHTLHLLPRLDHFTTACSLIEFDKFGGAVLQSAATMLNEKIEHLRMKKFDCSLLGISHLLQCCGKYREARQLVGATIEKTPKKFANGMDNPTYLLLLYAQSTFDLLGTSLTEAFEGFVRLENSFWIIKCRNLWALELRQRGEQDKANEIWQRLFSESRKLYPVFENPTRMILANLAGCLRSNHHRETLKALFESITEDAEAHALDDEYALFILEWLSRYYEGRGSAMSVLEASTYTNRPVRRRKHSG